MEEIGMVGTGKLLSRVGVHLVEVGEELSCEVLVMSDSGHISKLLPAARTGRLWLHSGLR
jgi:hypothetical protein